MQIIDAHMHYYDKEGFIEVAAKAGYENTAACWQRIFIKDCFVMLFGNNITNHTNI